MTVSFLFLQWLTADGFSDGPDDLDGLVDRRTLDTVSTYSIWRCACFGPFPKTLMILTVLRVYR
jgi:hypothetical protein